MKDRQQDFFQKQGQNISEMPSFASTDNGNLPPRTKIWGNLDLSAFLIFILGLIFGLVVYHLIRSQISPIPPSITPSLIKATITPLIVSSPTPYLSSSSTSSAVISDWKIYKDKLIGFEFKYPPQFNSVPLDLANSGLYQFLDNRLILMNQNKSFPEYKLVTEYFFGVSKSSKMASPANCFISQRSNKPLTETKHINGITFYTDSYNGAAAGNQYASKIYRTVTKDSCLEIALSTHSTSDWNTTETMQQAEREEETGFMVLNQILNTFKFIDQDEVGETNNWKTYVYKSTSSKYPSYSIKYPAGWTYTEEYAHGTADLRVIFSDIKGNEVLSFIVSRLDFIDDFYAMQSNYLGELKEVTKAGRKGYVFEGKYDYITAYYFPLSQGYVSFQLLDENIREIFELIPATLSLSR